MKRNVGYFTMIMLLACGAYLSGCDTSENTADPDKDYFVKLFGGDGNQYGVDMLLLEDGTFLLLGDYADNSLDSDLYLVHVDAEGNVIRETRFGEDESSRWYAKDMEQTDDGRIAILADYQKEGTNHRDIRLLRFASDFTFIDSVGFGTPANDYGRSITKLADGGFVISGSTEATKTFEQPNVTDPDLGDAFKFRVDANLENFGISWMPSYFGWGSRYDAAVRIIQKSDDLYYGFGYSNTAISGNNPGNKLGLIYFSIDQNGDPSNPVFVSTTQDDVEISSVHPLDAEFGRGVLAVGTAVNSTGNSRIVITRFQSVLNFDALGVQDLLLNSAIAIPRNLRGVSATASRSGETGFLILGDETRTRGRNIWISKITLDGAVLWSTSLGAESVDDYGAAIAELPDGRIAVLGTMGLADNQSKLALIKLNRTGLFLR